jgi:hypothetical protein
MALVVADRVQETATPVTTVSFTLGGAVTGFITFSAGIGANNTTYYSATDASGNWEVGLGTVNALATILTRTTILSSSNSGSAVTFSGTVNVFVTYPASKAVTSTVTVGQGGTGQTTYTDGQLLIGNSTGSTLTKTTLTAGAGVSITNGSGSISIASPLAKDTQVYTNATGATYTAPANTQWVKVTVVGPGGNGGNGTSARGTGGSAGGVAIKWLAMTAGQTLTYTVSTAGGTASTVSSGTLTITTITANSGSNGTATAYANSSTAGPTGGTATNGDVNITGGSGGNSYGSSTTVATNFSGKGGDCPGFGSGGGSYGSSATAGQAGVGYGAGGGGSHGTSSTATGAGGIIIFEAF